MKARVKATGEIVEIIAIDEPYLFCSDGAHYGIESLEGIEHEIDYWTRLKHNVAINALGSFILTNNIKNGDLEGMRECITNAMAIAHALVEKLKEEK